MILVRNSPKMDELKLNMWYIINRRSSQKYQVKHIKG